VASNEGHGQVSEPDDGPVVGMTGARFGGAQRRRRHRSAAAPAAGPSAAVGNAPAGSAALPSNPVVGRTGARFARAEYEPAAERAPAVAVPVPDLVPVIASSDGDADTDADTDADESRAADWVRVRPYVLTGGRTRTSRELPLESLVSIGLRRGAAATLEQRQVMDLCAQPRSIAEVAALVGVPLGVARVLVADLADTGAVTVHTTVDTDVDLMGRVLAGLHRL